MSDELERARAYASRIPSAGQGQRNMELNKVGITLMAKFDLTEADLEQVGLEWAARCDPPMDRTEASRTLASAFKGAVRKGIAGSRRTEPIGPSSGPRALQRERVEPPKQPIVSGEAPSLELLDRINMAIDGKIKLIDFGPWDVTSRLTRALVPETITVLAGMKGTSKTFFMLQAALHWLRHDVKFSMLMLEWQRKFYLQRLIGMLAQDSNLAVEEHYAAHPDKARAVWEKYQRVLDQMGYCIFDCQGGMSIDGIVTWVKGQGEKGVQVVVIDPISAKLPSRTPWIDDHNLINRLREVVTKHGMSIVLVTHPKTTRGKDLKSMQDNWGDDLVGGKAFGDFTDTILFLQYMRQEEMMACTRHGMTTQQSVNRLLQLRKTRFGRGQGLTVGFKFDGQTLLHSECGTISE